VKKKTFKENKKAEVFLVSQRFLNNPVKIIKYCARYWKKRITRKISFLKNIKFIKYNIMKKNNNNENSFLSEEQPLNAKQAFLKKINVPVEIKFFKTASLSFTPLKAMQGFFVFLFVLFSLFAVSNIFLPGAKIAESETIELVALKQTSAIIAGQPVKWTAIVKASDITALQKYVKIPKIASNIKIKKISKLEAEQIVKAEMQNSAGQLAIEDRKQLAKMSKPKNFLASITSFLFADLEQAVGNIIEQTAEQVVGQSPEIIQTPEASFVDLSSQAEPVPAESSGEAKEEKKEDKEKEEKQEGQEKQGIQGKEQEESTEQETPAEPAQSPADIEADEEPVQEPASAIGTPEPEASATETPQEETQTEPAETPEIVPSPETEVIELPETPLDQTTTPSDQEVVETEQTPEKEEEPFDDAQDEYVEIDYETPAPQITEQNTDTGKLVTVSEPEAIATSDVAIAHTYTDVLAFTTIPEIYKVGQESKIKIKWQNPDCEAVEDPRQAEACRDNGYAEMEFHAYDLNENGKLDYVEWTVPHLSEQIFEIIFISKAFKLDENREIIEDIYDNVRYKDNIWTTVENNQYVRVTFEQILDNTKDNTIYAKPAMLDVAVTVKVYPVYTDENGNQTEGPLIATFSAINKEDTYKVLLTNLQTPTDVFDLKIMGGLLDIDYIVDPSVSDSFADETKIGTGTNKVTISGGTITLEPCYAPNPSWTKTADTLVRDIAGAYNATVAKDIYCDDYNCVLWTDGAEAPGTVCIATDANVYASILWSKTDYCTGAQPCATTQTWADSNFSISGGDIGGTHTTLGVGNSNVAIGTKNWLERYYSTSSAGTFNAMDACKTKGLGWRLPTIVELDSIRDQAKGGAPYTYLSNIVSTYYWSSSEFSSTYPFYLNFSNGNVNPNLAKSSAFYVRCVRGY